jgi:hypothetical protein
MVADLFVDVEKATQDSTFLKAHHTYLTIGDDV